MCINRDRSLGELKSSSVCSAVIVEVLQLLNLESNWAVKVKCVISVHWFLGMRMSCIEKMGYTLQTGRQDNALVGRNWFS